jgi:hypothetical protein
MRRRCELEQPLGRRGRAELRGVVLRQKRQLAQLVCEVGAQRSALERCLQLGEAAHAHEYRLVYGAQL